MQLFGRNLLLGFAILCTVGVAAQPKLEFDLKKPQQYENRKLGSEKLAEKKFTFLRHFFQNNFTHYNYYFNANQKLNEIIEESRLQSADDYTRLLPFYPYSLDATSRSVFLDSIIQKCTAGILLHDLRNDWIDDLYLIMGKAYLLRKDFDSAAMTFQFINYSFAPKEEDGYDKLIGSNAEEGGNAFTISTKEKEGAFSYMVGKAPSRNESFVWQIRTLTEQSDFIDASSLIEMLRHDPNFPDRLQEELAEATAYLYYKMEMWDSAATYLAKSVSLAPNQEYRARRWYLAGQLYQLGGNYAKASEAYSNCTSLALDPVMEVYARLNSIRLNKGDSPEIIDENIAKMVAMAKKDKYQSYRDIIYYATALFEMERNGFDAASNYLQNSIKYNENNSDQRSQSFMLLGDINYAQKQYAHASFFYDSVEAANLGEEAAARLQTRKPPTNEIYQAVQVINLQDSLLQLASMDESERTNHVKQVAKQLRKERGLKDDPANLGSAPTAAINAQPSAASTLFSNSSGNWYFYDPALRANGFNKFRERWGARPNVDNWRRSSTLQQTARVTGAVDDSAATGTTTMDLLSDNFDTTDISFDNLYSRIPISQERQQVATSRLAQAYYQMGVALHEEIEDYPEAIKAFEKALALGAVDETEKNALFALVHCYTMVGDVAGANRSRQLLEKNGGSSMLAQATSSVNQNVPGEAATATYKEIYDLFIEGNFEQAITKKQRADSILGKNYWTPQLLYIESVYHIRQRDDSAAITALNNIISQFNEHPLAARSQTMVDVLRRRKEIETYLANLEITRAKEDEIVQSTTPRPRREVTLAPDTLRNSNTIVAPPVLNVIEDTSSTLVTAVPTKVSPYAINPGAPTMVAILLERVDPAYVNEVFYAFGHNKQAGFNSQGVEAAKIKLKDNLWLVTLRSDQFKDAETAFQYIDYIRPVAQKDIISWLDPAKYNYILLNQENLSLLQQDPNMELYRQVLGQTFPGKF